MGNICRNRDDVFTFLLAHLAQLVVGEGFDPLEFDRIYSKLRGLSDDRVTIDEIMEWIKTQNGCGDLRSALEFIFYSQVHLRFQENFLMTGLVPDHVRATIESLRLKGILTESVCDVIYKQALLDDSMIWTTDQLEEVIVNACGQTSLRPEFSLDRKLDLKINESFHS